MKCLSLATALLGGVASFAQLPTVDITVVALNSDTLEVRLLPDSDFQGLLSSLTFTLRWDTTGGAHVGALDQPTCTFNAAPAGSDGELENGPYRYYTINAFGFQLISASCAWTAGVEVPFVRIPIIGDSAMIGDPGCTTIETVNDSFTTATNRNYYISLNAVDKTGVIYGPGAMDLGDCTTGSAEEEQLPFTLTPNPANDLLVVSMDHEPLLSWRILDMRGREVAASNAASVLRTEIPIQSLHAGAYLFEARSATGRTQRRFVIAR